MWKREVSRLVVLWVLCGARYLPRGAGGLSEFAIFACAFPVGRCAVRDVKSALYIYILGVKV